MLAGFLDRRIGFDPGFRVSRLSLDLPVRLKKTACKSEFSSPSYGRLKFLTIQLKDSPHGMGRTNKPFLGSRYASNEARMNGDGRDPPVRTAQCLACRACGVT